MSSPFVPIQTAPIHWHAKVRSAGAFDEAYFSADNGIARAMHVFIHGNRLIERWQALPNHSETRFVIGATGFGTSLNFLLAWSIWDKHAPATARLHYIACDKHPLCQEDLQQAMTLWPSLSYYAEALLEDYPVLTPGMHRLAWADDRVTLDLMLGDVLSCYQDRLMCGEVTLEKTLQQSPVNAWFLDDCSPKYDAELWSAPLYATLFQLSAERSTLSAFSVSKQVSQALTQAGFNLQKQHGLDRKPERLIGTKNIVSELDPSSSRRLIKRKTPWHVSSQSKIGKSKHAIVIGAGLSGCFMAHALAKRGWQVSLLDERESVGQGASANQRAILFPNLSAFRAPLTELMLSAFLYAARFYRRYAMPRSLGDFCGILQLHGNTKTENTQDALIQWLRSYPELGQFVNAAQASILTGVTVHSGGIYIPMAGFIDSPRFCEHLIQTPGIRFFPHTRIETIHRQDERGWYAGCHTANVLILANGYLAHQFKQTAHLSIKPIRGQMTGITASMHSEALKIPLCGMGHIMPVYEGTHAIGATFDLGNATNTSLSADDEINLTKINALPAELHASTEIVSHWAAVRGAAFDHLPIVGPVADANRFLQIYAPLSRNANRFIGVADAYHPGLYIATGFGARGVTTVPLCTEYLAGLIQREPALLPQRLVQAISPARFLHRDILSSSSK
jgi:tRNA 5-methylaminomethyl-2-thiouridine biosynthesis bifunctional protein